MKTAPTNITTIGKISLLGLVLLLLAGCGEEIAEEAVVRPVKTMVLGTSEQGVSRVFPGTVQATQRVNLSFRVAGPLISVPVDGGQQVRRGQLLARIDARDFETVIATVEAGLSEAQAQLLGARAELLRAESNYARYRRLYEKDYVSKAELDQSRAARDLAQANVEATLSRIEGLKARLQDARDALEDTSLRAPFNGYVAEKFVDNFQMVMARQEILNLQDVSSIEIVFSVPESLVAQATQGQASRMTAQFESAPGREFDVRVKEVATQADPQTRTYPVTVIMRQPEGVNIFSGMTAEVALHLETQAGGFRIPSAAVFADEQGNQYVWVVDQSSMTPKRTGIRAGELTGDSIMALEGLNPGDVIVTAGTHFIQEGQQLRQIQQGAGARD